VARPGGRLVVAVWAPLETSPGYADMVKLLERFRLSASEQSASTYPVSERAALTKMEIRASRAS
jgi:hypothetical protein